MTHDLNKVAIIRTDETYFPRRILEHRKKFATETERIRNDFFGTRVNTARAFSEAFPCLVLGEPYSQDHQRSPIQYYTNPGMDLTVPGWQMLLNGPDQNSMVSNLYHALFNYDLVALNRRNPRREPAIRGYRTGTTIPTLFSFSEATYGQTLEELAKLLEQRNQLYKHLKVLP